MLVLSTNWATWHSMVCQRTCKSSHKMDLGRCQTIGEIDFIHSLWTVTPLTQHVQMRTLCPHVTLHSSLVPHVWLKWSFHFVSLAQLAQCLTPCTEHPALHPLLFHRFPLSKGCSHPEFPALIDENAGVTDILIQNLAQGMSPTGTGGYYLHWRQSDYLNWGSFQIFVLQPVIVVSYSRCYWKPCYASRSRLGPRTHSCSAGFTTVLTGARSRCGTIASLSLWKKSLDIQFISKSELHEHRRTCCIVFTSEKVESRHIFRERESNLLMF